MADPASDSDEESDVDMGLQGESAMRQLNAALNKLHAYRKGVKALKKVSNLTQGERDALTPPSSEELGKFFHAMFVSNAGGVETHQRYLSVLRTHFVENAERWVHSEKYTSNIHSLEKDTWYRRLRRNIEKVHIQRCNQRGELARYKAA